MIQEDIEARYQRSFFGLVESVVPSEIYLSKRAMTDTGIGDADIAGWLGEYRYGDNIGPYVPEEAIDRERFDQPIFAAVFPRSYLERLATADLSEYGPGVFESNPLGLPPITRWGSGPPDRHGLRAGHREQDQRHRGDQQHDEHERHDPLRVSHMHGHGQPSCRQCAPTSRRRQSARCARMPA